MPTPNGGPPHPHTPPASESDQLAYLETLARLERAGERSTLIVGPYSAFILISALQLALRHPEVGGAVAAELRRIVTEMRKWFAGTPGQVLLDQGDDPANDMTREQFDAWLARLGGKADD